MIRDGYYPRDCDGKRIQKYKCKVCGQGSSDATFSVNYNQKKRDINGELRRLLLSNVSLNRTAKLLKVNRKTVAARLIHFGAVCALRNERNLRKAFKGRRAKAVQFDELETFEKTKLIPLSVAGIVTDQRLVLGVSVSSMPAHEAYHERSVAKYGPLPDNRTEVLWDLLKRTKAWIHDFCTIATDHCPRYPWPVCKVFPQAEHKMYFARKAKPSGLGELKVGGFDPLFAINHTLAKFRANLARLNRRTWCTTKKRDRLMAHLAIFIESHNRYVLNSLKERGIPLNIA